MGRKEGIETYTRSRLIGYAQLLQEIAQEYKAGQKRAEELEELKKYVQTDSYVEEIAEEKLGLVHNGEIIFKTTK